MTFGDYVEIEQKRYGVKNEMYIHKVIGTMKSNIYVDVPVKEPAKETLHSEVVDIVECITCGVVEKEVLNYRISDVKEVFGMHSPHAQIIRNAQEGVNIGHEMEAE